MRAALPSGATSACSASDLQRLSASPHESVQTHGAFQASARRTRRVLTVTLVISPLLLPRWPCSALGRGQEASSARWHSASSQGEAHHDLRHPQAQLPAALPATAAVCLLQRSGAARLQLQEGARGGAVHRARSVPLRVCSVGLHRAMHAVTGSPCYKTQSKHWPSPCDLVHDRALGGDSVIFAEQVNPAVRTALAHDNANLCSAAAAAALSLCHQGQVASLSLPASPEAPTLGPRRVTPSRML